MVYGKDSSFAAVKNFVVKIGHQCFTRHIMQTSFSHVFSSRYHIYYDLNNSKLDFLCSLIEIV